MLVDTILQAFGMLVIAVIAYAATGVLLPKQMKSREQSVFLVTILVVCIAAGYYIVKADEVTPKEVVGRLDFEEVFTAYKREQDDIVREVVKDYLPYDSHLDLDDVLECFKTSREEIAWETMQDDRDFLMDYLSEYPDVVYELLEDWKDQ